MLGTVVGTLVEMSTYVDLLADVTADALIVEHLSSYGDRGSKSAKAYNRRVLYRAWGLTAHRGWACCLILDHWDLVRAPNTQRAEAGTPPSSQWLQRRGRLRFFN